MGSTVGVSVYGQRTLSDLNTNDKDIMNNSITFDNPISDSVDNNLINLYDKVDQSIVQVTYNSKTPGESRLGSGFVYDKMGHIITNYHVISGNIPDKDEFDITFIDGSVYKAKVIGSDPFAEIAVLKITNQQNNSQLQNKLVPLQIGNFSEVRVGQKVAAVGNPFGLSASITEGIVSGLGRLLPAFSPSESEFNDQTLFLQNIPSFSIPNIIQTDAAINPGNSGGPLLNMQGEVIGINTAIFSNTGAYTGVGFAIPSYLIQKVVPSLISTGIYEHPYLGISGIDVNPEIAKAMNLENSTGFLVIQVTSDSPAAKAGIRGGSIVTEINGRQMELGGDIIVAVDDKNIRKIDDLLSYLEREKEVGDNITLSVIRNGQSQKLDLTLATRPNSFGFGSEIMSEFKGTRPTLGITGTEVTREIATQMNIPADVLSNGTRGFLVIDVVKNGSAYDAGLRGGYIQTYLNGNQIELGGDVILSMEGISVHDVQDIGKALSTKSIGDVIQVTIYRDNETQKIPVTLKSGPQQNNTTSSIPDVLPPPTMPGEPLNPFQQPSDPFDNFNNGMYSQCIQIISKEACDKLFGR
jgi:S1-C subfamily serine protease